MGERHNSSSFAAIQGVSEHVAKNLEDNTRTTCNILTFHISSRSSFRNHAVLFPRWSGSLAIQIPFNCVFCSLCSNAVWSTDLSHSKQTSNGQIINNIQISFPCINYTARCSYHKLVTFPHQKTWSLISHQNKQPKSAVGALGSSAVETLWLILLQSLYSAPCKERADQRPSLSSSTRPQHTVLPHAPRGLPPSRGRKGVTGPRPRRCELAMAAARPARARALLQQSVSARLQVRPPEHGSEAQWVEVTWAAGRPPPWHRPWPSASPVEPLERAHRGGRRDSAPSRARVRRRGLGGRSDIGGSRRCSFCGLGCAAGSVPTSSRFHSRAISSPSGYRQRGKQQEIEVGAPWSFSLRPTECSTGRILFRSMTAPRPNTSLLTMLFLLKHTFTEALQPWLVCSAVGFVVW